MASPGTRVIDGTVSEQWPAATVSDPRKLRTITTVAHEPTDPARTPSPPAALGDVVEFLRAHPPFDALAAAEVERVAASAEVEFFLAGSTIFSQGAQPVEHLRVVRTGAVEIVLGGRVLDLLGAGELFGHCLDALGTAARASPRARRRTRSATGSPSRRRAPCSRDRRASASSRARCSRCTRRRPRRSRPRDPAPDPANQPVAALIRDPPVLCSPDTTIREAAAMTTAAGATSVVIDARRLARDPDRPGSALARGRGRPPLRRARVRAMSAPAYTVEPDRLGGDVLLEMLDRGIRHFPVVTREPRGDRRRRGGRPARRRDALLVQPAAGRSRVPTAPRSSPARRTACVRR